MTTLAPGSPASRAETSPPSSRRLRPWRLLALALLGLLMVALLGDYWRWRDHRDEHLLRLAAAGPQVATSSALRRVQRERTPIHARTSTVRALVYGSIQNDPTGQVPLEERLRRLREAENLAQQNLRQHPLGWESWMLLGTAVYSQRALANDRRLITEPKAWEDPLRRAVETGTTKVEASRMLAAPYLETWAYLSPEKKALTRDLLTQVFASDPEALERMAPLWLQLNGTREDALSIFPPHPRAWRFLETYFSRLRQFPAMIRAHEHHLDALEHSLAERLDEARQRLALGDPVASRELCLEVLVMAPRTRRFIGIVQQALDIQPMGLHGRGASDSLELWLDFLLTLDLYGLYAVPPADGATDDSWTGALSPQAMGRLIDAVEGLDDPVLAQAALLAEDLFTVRELEDEIPRRASAEWLAFLLSRARIEHVREGAQTALETLDRVDLISRDGLAFRSLDAQLRHEVGTPREIDRTRSRLDALRKTRWSSLAWDSDPTAPRLGLLPKHRARGLRVEIVRVERDGDVVDILWDGDRVGSAVVRPGDQLEIDLPVEPTVHLLELRSLRGEQIAPGRVELIP